MSLRPVHPIAVEPEWPGEHMLRDLAQKVSRVLHRPVKVLSPRDLLRAFARDQIRVRAGLPPDSGGG
jgi:hypothetical protein